MNSKSLSRSDALYVNMDALNVILLLFFITIEAMLQLFVNLFRQPTCTSINEQKRLDTSLLSKLWEKS